MRLYSIVLPAMLPLILGMDVCSRSETTIIGASPIISAGNSQGGSGSASPAPAGTCVAGAVASVRVGPFGFNCANGTTAPCNNCGTLPLACVATVTATPKGAADQNLPPAVHGSQITWTVDYGSVRLEDTENDDSAGFNKLVRPTAAGPFSVRATVCSVPGSWTAIVP